MLNNIGKTAKITSQILAKLTTDQKNQILEKIAIALKQEKTNILLSNKKDMKLAKINGLNESLQDRLLLTTSRLKNIIDDIICISRLEDPIGQIIDGKQTSDGLTLYRYRTPIGVICVIYESRPNITIDIATLCLKTGNAAILRSGKETDNTNTTIVNIIQKTLKNAKLPSNAIQIIKNYDRELIIKLLKLNKYIDMIIPRGGKELHKICYKESIIPILSGGIGICHIFVDEFVDFNNAIEVIINAKSQRPSACNSLETLLVHKNIASKFLPMLNKRTDKEQIILHASKKALHYLEEGQAKVVELKLENLNNEWLSLDLNIEIVDNIDAAIKHIQIYGSSHSDAILTDSIKQANYFIQCVDSATVYVNASTRFTDGGQFGLGSEVAVSTQKLHARGPVGLNELTTYKWVGYGNYLIRT
ncbi:Gamma-glutamyl phosphate reductase [Candidatus Providencia siddallii]|uniref:Gamma-glutamyl phosphate reductase n=1 Tax=Candidatus Providencia siddallii TaxID=1715285 RepID=A0A0M6W772_9GAMM|nr:Gamma-glutamyl phosphate reductase [Candidatus Providencia siddallii]